MAAKRGPTAYFIFSDEQREATRAECLAAAEPGAKISVATVAKAIGEKWRALSDETKADYKAKAAQQALGTASLAMGEAAAEATDDPAAGQEEERAVCRRQEDKAEALPAASEAHCQNLNPFGFPLSLVKRIMCMDPDVTRISGDGLKAVAKATELLLEHMAVKAAAAAKASKRKTVKFGDVHSTVCKERRLVEAGLKELLAESMFAEARGEGPLRDANRGNVPEALTTEDGALTGQQPAAKPGRKKAKEDDARARQITEFFTK